MKLLSLVMAAVFVARAASANVVATPNTGFAPGQIWSIKSPVPTTAKVIIGVVEPWNGKMAVHVRVTDIPAPPETRPNGELVNIDHLPFEEGALVASVDRLIGTGASVTNEFKQGYDIWRRDRNAGIFEISVSQAIAVMIEKIKRAKT
jgi:hypothetical protein